MWCRLSATILIALAPASLPAQSAASSAESEVERVGRQYLDARLANDTATIRRLLTEDYTGINSTGVLGDRASALRLPMNVTPMGQPIAGFDLDSIRVRVYGSAAVMTGIRRVRSAGGTGGGLRFTFVFINRDGRWQLTASQATDLQPRGRRGGRLETLSGYSARSASVGCTRKARRGSNWAFRGTLLAHKVKGYGLVIDVIHASLHGAFHALFHVPS